MSFLIRFIENLEIREIESFCMDSEKPENVFLYYYDNIVYFLRTPNNTHTTQISEIPFI